MVRSFATFTLEKPKLNVHRQPGQHREDLGDYVVRRGVVRRDAIRDIHVNERPGDDAELLRAALLGGQHNLAGLPQAAMEGKTRSVVRVEEARIPEGAIPCAAGATPGAVGATPGAVGATVGGALLLETICIFSPTDSRMLNLFNIVLTCIVPQNVCAPPTTESREDSGPSIL